MSGVYSTSLEKTFLMKLLQRNHINEFSYGFYSEADWKQHFQVVTQRELSKSYDIKRDVYFKYQKAKLGKKEIRASTAATGSNNLTRNKFQSKNLIDSDGHIDFVLTLQSKVQVAIEINIETNWKDSSNNAVFGGKDPYQVLKEDIMKLKNQHVDDKNIYDRKWSIIIARSMKQRKNLGKIIDMMNADDDLPKNCWFVYEHDGFLAVLHREERNYRECSNQVQRKSKQEKKSPFTKVEKATEQKVKGCENVEHGMTPEDPEIQFLSIIKNDYLQYKKALQRGYNWGKHAQVIISKRLQCDTMDYNYKNRIRKMPYGNGRNVDLYLEEVYAIEIKVETKTQQLEGGTFENVMIIEIDKLKKWKPSARQRRWVVAIMDASDANCELIHSWANIERYASTNQTKTKEFRYCPTTWDGAVTNIGTRELVKGDFFENAVVWTLKTKRPHNVLFILICLDGITSDCTI